MKLRNSTPRVLKGKRRNLSESDWRGITFKIEVSIWRCVLKFQTNVCKVGTWMEKKKQRNISSGYSLIMRPLKWRLYMKTDTRLFSVLSLLSINSRKRLSKFWKRLVLLLYGNYYCFQKDVLQKNVYEVDQELGCGELSPSACPGLGNRPPRKKKNCKSPVICPGGMVTVQIERLQSKRQVTDWMPRPLVLWLTWLTLLCFARIVGSTCYCTKTDLFDEGRNNFYHTAKISKWDEVKEDVENC